MFTKSSLGCIVKKATMIRANPYQSPCISSSGTKPGSAPGSRKRFRSISISENYPTTITHPHSYEGILKITRSSQTISGDLVGSPSLWSEKFKKKSTTASNKGPIIYFFDDRSLYQYVKNFVKSISRKFREIDFTKKLSFQ